MSEQDYCPTCGGPVETIDANAQWGHRRYRARVAERIAELEHQLSTAQSALARLESGEYVLVTRSVFRDGAVQLSVTLGFDPEFLANALIRLAEGDVLVRRELLQRVYNAADEFIGQGNISSADDEKIRATMREFAAALAGTKPE